MIWGGLLIRVIYLSLTAQHANIYASHEFKAPDWVLDARFAPYLATLKEDLALVSQAALVTSGNSLLLLDIPHEISQSRLEVLSTSYHSILYCAQIKWVAFDRILLAGGTAFGEILVWSCRVTMPESTEIDRLPLRLRGHEGSVFGVDISEDLSSASSSRFKRLLMSCSDDRSLRAWDISTCLPLEAPKAEYDTASDLAYQESRTSPRNGALLGQGQAGPSSELAIAWGHSSRIWGVRFVQGSSVETLGVPDLGLLSFGEDATCQEWHLTWACTPPGNQSSQDSTSCTLTHQRSMSLHTGRNIWSLALENTSQGVAMTATGGADGKIAYFAARERYTRPQENSLPRIGSFGGISLSSGGVEAKSEKQSEAKYANFDNEVWTKTVSHPGDLSNLAMGHGDNPKEEREQNAAAKLEDTSLASVRPRTPTTELKFLRSYSLIDEHHILATSDSGSVLLISRRSTSTHYPTAVLLNNISPDYVSLDGHEFTWFEVRRLEALKSYAVITSCAEHGVSFLAAVSGVIYCFHHRDRSIRLMGQTSANVSHLLCKESPSE